MAWIGFAMVITFMVLIMTRRLSAVVALILVPVVFGLIAGLGSGMGGMIMDGMRQVAPIAIMLVFAILLFSIMYDAGLFEPLVRVITRFAGHDPLRISLATAFLSAVTSLDGDGTSTVLIVMTAFLPVYLRIGMNPLIIALLILLTNTMINIIPWGGPTARVASALHLDVMDVFVGLIPAALLGLVYATGVAWWLGLRERKRLGWEPGKDMLVADADVKMPEVGSSHQRPKLVWINLFLMLGMAGAMGTGLAPLPVVMVVTFALALVINYPQLSEQKKRIAAHAENAVTVATLIFAAGVFTGILTGSGMVDAMSQSFVSIIPDAAGSYMALITAFASLPFTFFMSNDAYFFGIVPILAAAGAEYGVDPIHIARASMLGQPVHALSPLIAAIYVISGLLKREVGELQKFALLPAVGASLVFILGAFLSGAIS
ncbi:citrate transporter [Pseudomonas daroniae]|uniref:Citrate transporter n=1 Tax=Phytopseudomonas daroniae TaxID=2487519 RepID=A0A4Q9QKN0_9GAMM|nr:MULTISPECIES: citrate:proton symporter [Pseudomonas]TBU72862.1 citrate transporter [Pseudomonas daroniae]TBU79331.1 citrate transporter [Pseudomonas daroniae]TBU80113.1 citrate transporter [Pseudomonas sp. FRB 228]TBU91431.1 citrate transporter [Pseudomonas daroniae]